MEAPTLCIFQIYSLRLGLLCILDYNKMLSLPKNISKDWPFPPFIHQEISSSGCVNLPLTATGHGLLGGASSFWVPLRWDVLVGRRPYLLFRFILSSVLGANLACPLIFFMTFLYSCGKQSFQLKLQSASSTIPHCSGVPFLLHYQQLRGDCSMLPRPRMVIPQRTVGILSLGPLHRFHFIKLDRAQLRSVCCWFLHKVIFSRLIMVKNVSDLLAVISQDKINLQLIFI